MDFSNALQARVIRANDALRRFIEPQPFQNTPLVEAMHYGALLGVNACVRSGICHGQHVRYQR